MERDQYQAIACSLYDRYEIAILRSETLDLVWTDDTGHGHRCRVKPLELVTRKGEEFLRFSDVQDPARGISEIRLDRIRLEE